MSAVEARLAEAGYSVPAVAAPVAAYIPAVASGQLVFTSGQLPTVDGNLLAEGLLGADVDVDTAYACARQCALNAIAAVKSVVGDLDKVARVVKVVGFVASTPDFTNQPAVVNGASEILATAFGDAGIHARSAVGVVALPKNAPVEVEIIVEVK